MKAVLNLTVALFRFGLIIPVALYEELRAEPFDYESRTSR